MRDEPPKSTASAPPSRVGAARRLRTRFTGIGRGFPEDPRFPPQVQRVCLDADTDTLLYKFGMGAGRNLCSKLDVRNVGGKLEVDSVCKLGNSQMSSHIEMSFQGDTSYHEDIAVHYDPPLLGKTNDSKSTQDGKWIGACGADMKPGDMVTVPSPTNPVPMRLNLNQMLKDGS
jgi:hypothetical protein